jgi:hypothetical protein
MKKLNNEKIPSIYESLSERNTKLEEERMEKNLKTIQLDEAAPTGREI